MAGRPRLRPGEIRTANARMKPDGTWEARGWTLDAGGERRNPRGRGATEADARADLQRKARALAYVAEGIGPSTTLAELLDEWIADREGAVRIQTVRIYRDTRRWLTPMAGALTVEDLTPARIKRLLIDVETRRSAAARLQARVAIKGALAIAVDADVIRHNPVLSVRREKREGSMPITLTVGQVNVLRRLVRERAERSERFVGSSAFVLMWAMEVALGSGLRISEVAGLRNADVNLEVGTLDVTGTLVDDEDWRVVRQDELKTRAQARVIELPGFAVRALRAARASQTTVPDRLPGAPAIRGRSSGYVQPRNLSRTLRALRVHPDMISALAGTGLEPEDLTSHVFRKTAGTLAAAAAGDLEAARRLLGHADIRTTETAYAGAAWRAVGSAVALEKLLGEEAAS